LSDAILPLVFNKNSSPIIDSTHLVLLVLIKAEDLHTAEAISNSVQSEFFNYYAPPSNLLKEQLRLSLKNNDLLGFLYFKDKNIAKMDNSILIKRMHLFH
jgi:hypothetical protein